MLEIIGARNTFLFKDGGILQRVLRGLGISSPVTCFSPFLHLFLSKSLILSVAAHYA